MAIITGIRACVCEVKLVTQCWESAEAVCVVAGINGRCWKWKAGHCTVQTPGPFRNERNFCVMQICVQSLDC